VVKTAIETWQGTPAAVKTIITAALGIIIGAWLTSRSQTKCRVVDELKVVHAACALCFSITPDACAKEQRIRPMKERHDGAVAVNTAPGATLALSSNNFASSPP